MNFIEGCIHNEVSSVWSLQFFKCNLHSNKEGLNGIRTLTCSGSAVHYQLNYQVNLELITLVGQWLACRWWVWFYLILYYVMLIDESQIFELHIERKLEVCTTIQTSFLSTVLMHEFHASTSYTVHMYFNNYYSLNPNGLWVNSTWGWRLRDL